MIRFFNPPIVGYYSMPKNVILSGSPSQNEMDDTRIKTETPTRHLQILLSFSVLSIVIYLCGILSAWNTPYTGYEPNIYSATPILFWIGIVSCYIVGIIYILVGLQTSYRKLSKLSLGFICLSLAALAQIALPFLRGYFAFFIAGDAGTHVGRITQTITQGSIYPVNTYYPGIYAESSFFQILTGWDVFSTLAYLPILLFAVYLIGVLLLSHRLFPKIHERLFVMVIALLLPSGSDGVLYISFVPYLYQGQMFANTLLPYVLFLILTAISINKRSIVLLVIACIAMFFYHPIPSLSVVIFLVSVVVWATIKRDDTWRNRLKTVLTTVVLLLSILVGFILVHWDTFGHTILKYVSTTFSKILEVIMPSPVTPTVPVTPPVSSPVTITELLTPSHYDSMFAYLSQLYITATSYGITIDVAIRSVLIGIFIYGLFIIAIIIYLRYLKGKTEYHFISLFSIYGIALIILTLGLYLVNASGHTRLVPHIFMIAVVFSGFVISQIYSKLGGCWGVNSRKRLWTIFCILLIVCLLSVISFHPSPFTMNGGSQTSEAEYIGTETILQYVDSPPDIIGVHFTSINRFIATIYGSSPYGDTMSNAVAPRHFGYDSGKISLVDSVDSTVGHLIITDKDLEYYPTYVPQLVVDRYTETDYLHLTMDNGLEYVYNNGGFRMYDVMSQQN